MSDPDRDAVDGGDTSFGGDGDGDAATDWPVDLAGVTESVVATLGPNGLWNLAALGLHAPEHDSRPADAPVRARTWGRTRTRRNFAERGGGVVQFVADPRDFVDAAATVREEPEPMLDSADAWAEVTAERVNAGERGGTEWVDWHLHVSDAAVERTAVRTINRGFGAVIDATVAASRVDVPAYDTEALLARLRYFADVVDRCGGPAEREAFQRLREASAWEDRDGDGDSNGDGGGDSDGDGDSDGNGDGGKDGDARVGD
ncbi:DUF447 domain-containing protein [Halobaculum gomorrense]|uniref:DUF447 family protein n=1 Tax=Halobaculum gomorrense TaxID=43928 RepID=A0A1M5S9C3_9EURY|nr:DUF447 domain-containing protein [Halobaculum gomorrense]SHH34513.1 hypothetical protein SAMN05443636_2368 [Halobaculum gomorrense]